MKRICPYDSEGNRPTFPLLLLPRPLGQWPGIASSSDVSDSKGKAVSLWPSVPSDGCSENLKTCPDTENIKTPLPGPYTAQPSDPLGRAHDISGSEAAGELVCL